MNFEILEKYRKRLPPMGTKTGDEFGVFFIPYLSYKLKVICAPMTDIWQHVSVSLPNRCPNWQEMTYIKDLFWGENETVIQFHPKKSEYVNMHPYCLHLWKKRDEEYELPPSLLVGLKNLPKSAL